MLSPSIGIIGCGWLGNPLANELSKTHKVQCFHRAETTDTSNFYQNDLIIIAINTKDNYLATLRKISTLTKPSAQVILMSSTSVYREFDKEIDETATITLEAKQIEAERLLQNLRKQVLILRLGGLMGEDRISGKWKSVSTFSDGPVNYIHKDDVINSIKFLIEKDVKEGLFNCVAPEHPLRSQVHEKNAKAFNLQLGSFEGLSHRVVQSKRLEELGYKFLRPNPLDFWS